MNGYKTLITMAVALAVALYQYYAGPLPAVDPKVFNIAVPIVGIVLRFLTTTPVGGK